MVLLYTQTYTLRHISLSHECDMLDEAEQARLAFRVSPKKTRLFGLADSTGLAVIDRNSEFATPHADASC